MKDKYEGSILETNIRNASQENLKAFQRFTNMAVESHKENNDLESIEFFTKALSHINSKLI